VVDALIKDYTCGLKWNDP